MSISSASSSTHDTDPVSVWIIKEAQFNPGSSSWLLLLTLPFQCCSLSQDSLLYRDVFRLLWSDLCSLSLFVIQKMKRTSGPPQIKETIYIEILICISRGWMKCSRPPIWKGFPMESSKNQFSLHLMNPQRSLQRAGQTAFISRRGPRWKPNKLPLPAWISKQCNLYRGH